MPQLLREQRTCWARASRPRPSPWASRCGGSRWTPAATPRSSSRVRRTCGTPARCGRTRTCCAPCTPPTRPWTRAG
ncbi:hypothetical protein NKH77_47380 [Streptomyces sp. M19]